MISSLFILDPHKKLHKLLKDINEIHPSIQFTMSHTSVVDEAIEDKCDCTPQTSIPFLDTLCSIQEGRIDTDLHKKRN